MADYITPDDLRDYIGSTTANFASVAQAACTVASRTVETICERVFFADTVASAQYFTPDSWYCCQTDDISTTADLAVTTDDAADGTYSTVWTLDTDYYLEPVNRIVGGISGYPYTELRSLRFRPFFLPSFVQRRPPVKVVARWGWAAVPEAVTHACLLGAARLFKMKDAPDGFVGLAGWGPVQIRENPEVRALLTPYMKSPYVIA